MWNRGKRVKSWYSCYSVLYMTNAKKVDFLIIGAGIIGVTIALELERRFPDCLIAIVEKENDCADHASGRNSGVLHAGFYYSADSLKARFCREGNIALREYCWENNISLKECGKLVVAKDEHELRVLDKLLEQGRANGVEVFRISEKQAKEIEPRIKTLDYALWSPTTSSVPPKVLVSSLLGQAKDRGVQIYYQTKFEAQDDKNTVYTSQGEFSSGYLINTAGLYADRIAHMFGFGENLKILPFKGLYLYCKHPEETLGVHVYPVPDLNYPFLGVHHTVTVDGKLKIGPTTVPAFWREQYTALSRFDMRELMEVLSTECSLFMNSNFDFRGLASVELKKQFRKYMVELASKLVSGISKGNYSEWGRPGIRAQLYDRNERNLVSDFCVQGDSRSFHVLNAVSPAFTASIPFANYCCDEIQRLIEN